MRHLFLLWVASLFIISCAEIIPSYSDKDGSDHFVPYSFKDDNENVLDLSRVVTLRQSSSNTEIPSRSTHEPTIIKNSGNKSSSPYIPGSTWEPNALEVEKNDTYIPGSTHEPNALEVEKNDTYIPGSTWEPLDPERDHYIPGVFVGTEEESENKDILLSGDHYIPGTFAIVH